MMRILFSVLLVFISLATAHAQTIVGQVAYADDGYVYVENPTEEYQNFSVSFYNEGGLVQTCGGVLAPLAYLVPCSVPSGADYAEVSSPALGYINFTGNRLYGVPRAYTFFSAQQYTGIAIINASSSTVTVSVRWWGYVGFNLAVIDETEVELDPYSMDVRYAYEWFPGIASGGPHYMEIFENFSANPAVLKVICAADPSWGCEQV